MGARPAAWLSAAVSEARCPACFEPNKARCGAQSLRPLFQSPELKAATFRSCRRRGSSQLTERSRGDACMRLRTRLSAMAHVHFRGDVASGWKKFRRYFRSRWATECCCLGARNRARTDLPT